MPAPDGAIAFPLLEDGPGKITVMAKGFIDLKRELVVSPDKDIDLGTLVMQRGRRTRFIILDEATGAPLVGARAFIGPSEHDAVEYTGQPPGTFYGNLDTEGGADVEDLPFTPVVMTVSLGSDEFEREVTLGRRQETVTVRMPAPKH
ncbi:hypothetical protein [Corallococcus sp. EGB]|uniref:hypothetical protein n=1 Tax=Corallococcus sp. EGB TaxID=1521117 RepID=UPI001CBEB814|nr:hypothetical protein [Corallococcus sp. EGB]